jgi:hypothetical protein
MRIQDFEASLGGAIAPERLSPYLTALWHEKHGDWSKAHEIVQEINDPTAAWVHAYLHRREGDQGNAEYWYRRADKPAPSCSLDQEWSEIVESLL